MVELDFIDDNGKTRIIGMWKGMSEADKAHFINQAALALSIWGDTEKGRRLIVETIRLMAGNGTNTLADFGLYVEKLNGIKEAGGMSDKIKRAVVIIEGYRVKNGLSSEPHRELF